MLHKANPLTEGIAIGGEGKLYWGYTLNLWRRPVLLWCLNLIDNAALDYDLCRCGLLHGGVCLRILMVSGITGITFAGRPLRYRWYQVPAYIQLVAGALLLIPLRSCAALTL